MAYTDLLNAKYIALAWEEAANANPTDYLGARLFGFKKQMSLEMKWLKGAGGLPVALAPAAFDAEIALRGRIDAAKVETEMPLFREGIQLTESDRRALMEAAALGDSYAQDVLTRIFNDTNNLIRGAKVVPERMIWQLLAPTDGKPKISIAGNDVNYAYDYDPKGTWYANNFIDGSSTPWSAAATAKPIDDFIKVGETAKAKGNTPKYAIMSQKTMTEMMNTAQVKSAALAQNVTANVFMTPEVAKSVVESITGIRPIVYNAIYAGDDGKPQQFMPDKVVSIIPEGMLGNTVYAMTSEEYELKGDGNKNVAIVDGGISVTTVETSAMPPRVATYASEIVLPSYERMDEVFELKVDADE
ncbi:MAG: major capsid protein [Lachnospiraceae bacterium]|nr:major capsid protein [Lachnospiraceae bacterium]